VKRLALALVVAAIAAGATVAATLATRSAPAPRPVPNHAFHGITGQPSSPVVVWAVGDGAAGTSDAKRLARRIAADRPDRVLYLGDVYESGTPAEFRDHFTTVYGPLRQRMLPTPGNHEWPNHLEGYDRYWRGVTHSPTPPWYAVRLGSWQLLSLNSEAPHDAGDPQLNWLQRRLERSAPCRLAFWHRPRFSAGTHGDQGDIQPLWDALVGRATLVLNGHDHDLQRLTPIKGTVEIVDGAGGRGHYPVDTGYARLAFSDDQAYGAVRLALRPTRADVTAVSVDGKVLDRAKVPCV
jgi:hypothetical protein